MTSGINRSDTGDIGMREVAEAAGAGDRTGWARGVSVVGTSEAEAGLVGAVLERDGLDVEPSFARDAADLAQREAGLVVVFGGDPAAEVRAIADAHPDAAIVVVTDHVTCSSVRRLLDRGARAIVARESWPATLAVACRAVMTGQVCVPVHARSAVEPPALSLRERQVLALMAGGLTNGEIAKQLFLAESTVKSHAASAFRRLGVNSRREAVALVLGSSEALRRIVLTSQPGERIDPGGHFQRNFGS